MAKTSGSKGVAAVVPAMTTAAPKPVLVEAPPAPVVAPTAAAKAGKAKKAKAALRDRLVVQLARTAKRLERLGVAFGACEVDEDDAEDVARVAKYLKDAALAGAAAAVVIGKLPATFKPGKATPEKAARLAVGAKVEIAVKKRADYAGAIDAEDMLALEVVKVVDKRVVVATADGLRTVIHSAHLRPAGAGAAADAKAAAKAG